MRKDPTEFRKRFQSWKQGIPAYRAGKPIGEDEDTRSDTTRQGYNEHGVPFDAGRGPAGDSPLKILDIVNEKTAAVPRRAGLVMGEPPAVGIRNPGMFNTSYLQKLFGAPSKAVGRQPMFMTDAIKSNTTNLKSALMRYEGNAPSKLTKQGKAWVDYNKNNVDLSQFTAMDVNKLVKMNRKDLNQRSGQFVKVTKGGPGFADYTFDVMKNGSSIADMEIGLRNGVAVPEMVSSFTKQPGMSRTLYDAAIQSGNQLGYNGLLSGEQLISAPKTWSVWEHYPTKKLIKENGIHQNRMMTSNPNKDGRRLKNLEEAKKAAEEGRSFTIENGPVYLLDKESQFVPVKSADVFDAGILDANGVFHRNMNSTNIYKAMLPFAIGGGLWGSDEYKSGKDIYIKPSHRGRLTALKKRTGKSEAELYRTGSAATRKMITFARNARKWKH